MTGRLRGGTWDRVGKKIEQPWVRSLVAPPSILGPFKQLPSPAFKERVTLLFSLYSALLFILWMFAKLDFLDKKKGS